MKLYPSAPEKLCYTPWNFQGKKTRLSWSPLEMPILTLIDVWNFHIVFFQYTPKKFQVLTVSHDFFENTPSKLMPLHGEPSVLLKNEAAPHPHPPPTSPYWILKHPSMKLFLEKAQ